MVKHQLTVQYEVKWPMKKKGGTILGSMISSKEKGLDHPSAISSKACRVQFSLDKNTVL